MSIKTKPIPLSAKEGEAIMWGLAQIGDHLDREPTEESDPLYILLKSGYSRKQIGECVEQLWPVAYSNYIGGGWTELEQLILRLCIENTSWISAYRNNEPSRGKDSFINEALSALRSLAGKLDLLGVEVNHIPFE